MGECQFRSSRKVPALQAADLLAFEARKHAKDVIERQASERTRPPWTMLQERTSGRIYGEHLSYKRFQHYNALQRRLFGGRKAS